MLNRSVKTDLLFLVFAMLWGVSYPITQSIIGVINPYLFVFLRFLIATLVMLPFIVNVRKREWATWLRIGVILGVLNTGIYTFEALSLKYTSVSKSAFIMGSNVIMVPFLTHIFRISRLTVMEVITAIIFLSGLYILTGSHFDNVNQGDVLALLGAVAIGLSITYLQHVSKNDINPIVLTFYQLLFTCPIPILFYLFEPSRVVEFSGNVVIAILFCGVFATTIPLLGQIKLQKNTSAAQAASMFALEPIFACLFGYIFFGELVTSQIVIGAVIMLASALVPVIVKSLQLKNEIIELKI